MIAWLIRIAPLALLVPAVRNALEARMFTHMLVEFPLLVASGCCAPMWLAGPVRRILPRADRCGLIGLTWTSCVLAVWMIPLALDYALVDTRVALAKYATLWAAGVLLRHSWPAMPQELQVFLVGNLAWMQATAGLLILESDQRLCVNYLFDDQAITGGGLLVAAGVVLLAPVVFRSRPLHDGPQFRRSFTQAVISSPPPTRSPLTNS
jgi:hypothetical protein